MAGKALGEEAAGRWEQGPEDGSAWGLEGPPLLAIATQSGVGGDDAERDGAVRSGELRVPGHGAFGPVKCWEGGAGGAAPWPLQTVGC